VDVVLADDTGYPHKGFLDFAGISLNPTTGTLMLRAIVPNRDAVILPGLFARVRAPLAEEKEALLVPETAIGYDQIGSFVRVVNDKNVVERRGVKLGNQVDTHRVVLEGLQGDEWVVVSGLMRAIPGRPVAPERSAPQPGPGNAKTPGPNAVPRKAAP
jgi:RND family efflux transporter MFP subunit